MNNQETKQTNAHKKLKNILENQRQQLETPVKKQT